MLGKHSSSSGFHTAATALCLTAVTLVGCSVPVNTATRVTDGSTVVSTPTEKEAHSDAAAALLEGYSDLRSLTRSMDYVVLASVSDVRGGRIFAPDGDEMRYAVIELDIDSVLAGKDVAARTGKTALVERLLPPGTSPQALVDQLPSSPAIFFLRSEARLAPSDRLVESSRYYTLSVPGAVIIRDETGNARPLEGDGSMLQLPRAPFDSIVDDVAEYGKLPQLAIDVQQDGNAETVDELAQRVAAAREGAELPDTESRRGLAAGDTCEPGSLPAGQSRTLHIIALNEAELTRPDAANSTSITVGLDGNDVLTADLAADTDVMASSDVVVSDAHHTVTVDTDSGTPDEQLRGSISACADETWALITYRGDLAGERSPRIDLNVLGEQPALSG